MPLLLVAILTHVIYRAISNGLDWTGEVSRRAWGASLDHSRSAADRLRQRMTDTLDSWDQDPRGRRYAATGVRLALGTGRLLGKIGVGTLLGTLKAAGAVSRVIAGGALATGGLLGAVAGSVRWGAREGATWWRDHHGSGRWSWFNWFPGWTEKTAEAWRRWGDTYPGETGPDPQDEDQRPPVGEEDPKDEYENDPYESGKPDPEPEEKDFKYEYERGPYESDRPEDPGPWWDDEKPATTFIPEDHQEPQVVVVGWGDPINENAKDPTTRRPTPVGSSQAGAPAEPRTATVVLDRPTSHATEGDSMLTEVATTSGGGVASISNSADGMQYEQAQAFLQEQERRARDLASMAEQIHALQLQLQRAAAVMGGDHSAAEAALARFGVQAPNVTEAISLLSAVASPAPAEAMVSAFMALDLVASGCDTDARNLQERFGHAWETTQAEQVDGQFYNG